MAVVAPVITAYFDLSAQGGDFFTVEHPTLGALDTGGPLAGDVAVEVSARGYAVNINRGRNRDLDEIPAGTCRINFRNQDRSFDPAYDAGDYFPNIVPGKRVTVSIYGVTIFDGTADDWENAYEATKETDASVLCVDALGVLARKDFDAWTTSSQKAGARIAAVLSRNEVVYAGGTDLDVGVETLQADNVSWGSNVLNYLQLVVKSDLGRLFASRAGVLTFRDRLSTAGPAAVLTFADDGSGFEFNAVQKRSAAELLYTRVGVDREGGTLQTVTDIAAVDLYGVRTLSLGGLLLNTDARSLALAQFLLGIYKSPEDRIAALTINVSGYADPADQASVAALDIGDLVNVVWTPAGVGDPIEALMVVEGVAHQSGVEGPHLMTVSFTSVAMNLFILDDALWGLLDGEGVLAA